MARPEEIRYIQYYSVGSAARQPELPQPKPRRRQQPKAQPKQAQHTRPGFVALAAPIVVVALVLCMGLCAWQYIDTCREVRQMTDYVSQLQTEQQSLQLEYESKVDLVQVRIVAESMGMVPVEQVRHILIAGPEPAVQTQPGFWQQLWEQVLYFFS